LGQNTNDWFDSRAQPEEAKGAEAEAPLARSKLRKKIKIFNF